MKKIQYGYRVIKADNPEDSHFMRCGRFGLHPRAAVDGD
jgi:hypothetical protein